MKFPAIQFSVISIQYIAALIRLTMMLPSWNWIEKGGRDPTLKKLRKEFICCSFPSQ